MSRFIVKQWLRISTIQRLSLNKKTEFFIKHNLTLSLDMTYFN